MSLEEMEIKLAAYFSQWPIEASDFEAQWSKIESKTEKQAFKLSFGSKQAAIQELTKKYGMTCVSNEEIQNSKSSINLAGKFLATYKVLMNVVVGFDTSLGCIAQVKAISEKEGLASELIESVAY